MIVDIHPCDIPLVLGSVQKYHQKLEEADIVVCGEKLAFSISPHSQKLDDAEAIILEKSQIKLNHGKQIFGQATNKVDFLSKEVEIGSTQVNINSAKTDINSMVNVSMPSPKIPQPIFSNTSTGASDGLNGNGKNERSLDRGLEVPVAANKRKRNDENEENKRDERVNNYQNAYNIEGFKRPDFTEETKQKVYRDFIEAQQKQLNPNKNLTNEKINEGVEELLKKNIDYLETGKQNRDFIANQFCKNPNDLTDEDLKNAAEILINSRLINPKQTSIRTNLNIRHIIAASDLSGFSYLLVKEKNDEAHKEMCKLVEQIGGEELAEKWNSIYKAAHSEVILMNSGIK